MRSAGGKSAKDLIWERVWIIGASSGIGLELARQISSVSKTVFISARSEDKLVSLAGERDNIVPVPLDVTDEESVAEVVSNLTADGKSVDLVVVSSATWKPAKVTELQVADFREVMETNYLAAVHVVSKLVPVMADAGKGQIGLIASVAGYRGLPNAGTYAPTKAALINFAECIRPQLTQLGIAVSIINPGFVETPMTAVNKFPMPFLMKPEEAASRIIAGLENKSYEIAFPMRMVLLLKLARLMPNRLFFWLVGKFMLKSS